MMTRNNVHDPVLIDTVWGSVAVFGHELVSKKDLVILGECLSLPEFTIKQADHRVRSVVFRSDNIPYSSTTGRPILANCSFDAGAICINLQETFRASKENALENPLVSVVASYHRNLILSFLHEIHHLAMLDGLPESNEIEKSEDEANKWAWARLVQLAQTVNVEPAHFSECSFLNEKLSILNSFDSWSHDQYNMMDNRVMYTLKNEGYYTFKGYIRLIAGGKESDPKWSKTIPINSDSKPVYVKPVPEYRLDELVYVPVVQPPITQPPTPIVEYEEEYPQYNNHYDDDGVTYEPIQASTSPPPVQPIPVTVQSDSPLSADERAKIVIGVYERCNAFIFDNCKQIMNSDQAFENPEKVMSHGIPITELERSVIVKMDCQDANGRWCPTMSTSGGMLFGGVMKNTKLPYYKLFINMGAGVHKCRLLLPQNPAKLTKEGEYTFPAQQTRAGNEMLYINEGDDIIKKKHKDEKKSDFYFKIINRVFMKA